MLKRISLAVFSWIAFSSHAAFGDSGLKSSQSLGWEQLALTQRIQQVVRSAISGLVSEQESLINVDIHLNSDAISDHQSSDLRSQTPEPLIVDDPNAEIPEDYILFHKIGLAAPYVDPNASKTNAVGKSNATQQQRTTDIFSFLEGISIEAILDTQTPVQDREAIQKILDNLNFNLGNLKPTIELKYMDLTKKHSLNWQSHKEQIFNELLDSIGLLLAVALLCFFAWKLYSKYEKQLQEMRPMQSRETVKKNENKEEEKSPLEEAVPILSDESKSGIQRFQSLLLNSRAEAAQLVKKWIYENTHEAQFALTALTQYLASEELTSLFPLLSKEDRSQWNELIIRDWKAENTLRADRFISDQIIEGLIVPNALDDPETMDILINMSAARCAEFASQNLALGKIIINVMGPTFVKELLSHLSPQDASNLLLAGMDLTQAEIDATKNDLKEKLLPFRKHTRTSPLLKKVISLIPLANPRLEGTLYEALTKVGDYDSIEKLAHAHFPAHLIERLPAPTLRNLLKSYPSTKKVKLLASLDEPLKATWINIISDRSSRFHELLMLEFEKIENDPSLEQEIQDNKEIFWEEFVASCRHTFSSDSSYSEELAKTVKIWLSQCYNNTMEENELSNKEAA